MAAWSYNLLGADWRTQPAEAGGLSFLRSLRDANNRKCCFPSVLPKLKIYRQFMSKPVTNQDFEKVIT